MERWILGEKRVISAVSLGTVSGASYEVFDTSDVSVVASGEALITDLTMYFLWEPADTGVYIARINYTVGDELLISDQVIEVMETM
jgi:hypothetical protein